MPIETIKGSRAGVETLIPKEHSTEHLKLQIGAGDPFADLVRKASNPEAPANCIGRLEEFAGDTLPTKPQARRMCKGCPAWDECDTFLRVAKPRHGVYAGQVRGGNS